MMRKENMGAHFITPISQEKVSFVGCSFVDDTDLVLSSYDSSDTLEDITPSMQHAIDTWEGGLRATGGALVPEKSWVYPIKYEWDDKGNHKLTPLSDIEAQFTVKDAQQNIKPLTLTPPTEAKETLGVFLAPDGSHSEQINYLRSKVLNWSEKIRTNHISPYNALLSIHTTILSTLKYPAPSLSLTRKDWQHITSPLYQTGLQSAGFCNKIPRAIRQGAISNLGLQIPCMYITQGILKLLKYIAHIEEKSILGQMLRLSEETITLELGMSQNLFDIPYKSTHFLTTNSWMKHLWKFLQEHQIHLQSHSPQLDKATNNDKFLMDLFLAKPIPKRDLIMINKCRKYLRVLTIGDIITGDGKSILRSIKYGQHSTNITSRLSWPNQSDPGQKAWTTWRRALKTLETNHSLRPQFQPTAWITTKQRTFNWFYHRGLDKLFQRANHNKWHYYSKTIHRGRRRRHPAYYFRGVLNSLPAHSTPATTTHLSINRILFTGTLALQPNTQTNPTLTSLPSFIQSLPPQHRSPLLDLDHIDHVPHIIQNISHGNCALVTDGSFFPTTQQSAASFVLGNEAAHRRIVGRCHLIGPPSSYSAYRAELAGLHSGFLFLLGLCKAHNIQEGRIIVACDNKGALQRIARGNIKPQEKHFDYLSAIVKIISELKISITYTHVDGHKDRVKAFHELTILECMNVQADTHAKVKASIPPPNTFHHDINIHSEWSPIRVQTQEGKTIRLHSNLDKTLYNLLTIDNSRSYWTAKMKIPPSLKRRINWTSLGSAFKSISKNKQKEVLKWHSGFCGTNATLFRRKQAQSAECPGCHFPSESTDHILKCAAAGATKLWNEEMDQLHEWMLRHDAAPELAKAIINGLHSWRNNHPPDTTTYSLPHLNAAVMTQTQIGWKGFIHGFLATEWEAAQSNYLQFKNKRITGKRWKEALIKKLWQTIWSIWRYRNGLVHEQTNHPLHKVTALINITIMQELQHGIGGLPSNYSYLFKKNFFQVLKTSLNQKKQWVLTVWAARDSFTPTHPSTRTRNSIISSIMLAWKKRIQQYENYQPT